MAMDVLFPVKRLISPVDCTCLSVEARYRSTTLLLQLTDGV